MLREEVSCFGADDCYPFAFGTTAGAMAIALLLFVVGKYFYIREPPTENMLVKVCKCVAVRISDFFRRLFAY